MVLVMLAALAATLLAPSIWTAPARAAQEIAATAPAVDAAKAADLVKAIDAADKAVKANQSKKAIEELRTARQLAGQIAQAAGVTMAQMPICNANCPILSDKVDPKVTTRMHKGQRVGFCCSDCLGSWDKLSEKEKDAKLSEAENK